MKFMLLAAAILMLSSCNGGSDSDSSDKNRPEVRCTCMPITYLSLNSTDVLPKNLKITADSEVIFDSCREFPSVAIQKTDHLVRFSFPGVVQKILNLEILDRGEDCRNDALFFDQQDVPYSRNVTSDRPDKPRTEEVTIEI